MEAISSGAIADRLLKGREYRRLSQAGVAREVKRLKYRCSHTSVGEYERGDAQPPLTYGAAFCKALALRPQWLIWGEGPMEATPEHVAHLFFALAQEITTSPLPESELRHRLATFVDLMREVGVARPVGAPGLAKSPD